MKKVLLLFVICFATIATEAQEKKEGLKLEEITFGIELTGTARYAAEKNSEKESLEKKRFDFSYGFGPLIGIETNRTKHELGYNIKSHGFEVFTGYFIPRSYCAYIRFEKNLKEKNEKYLGIGIQKVLVFKDWEWLEISPYLEFGANFPEKSGSVGIFIYPNLKLFSLDKIPRISLGF